MTDYYTHVCFAIPVTQEEASLIIEVQAICEELTETRNAPFDETGRHAACSEAFRTVFPIADRADPFGRLRAIFSDPSWTSLSAAFSVTDRDNEAGKLLEVCGDTVDPWEIANLLRIVTPSATPFAFGYANTASRDRYDVYSGGSIEVRRDKLVELTAHSENTDEQRLVIGVPALEDGLLFWNAAAGWGDLGAASVYSERDRETLALPASDAPALWIALPPRHAYFEVAP